MQVITVEYITVLLSALPINDVAILIHQQAASIVRTWARGLGARGDLYIKFVHIQSLKIGAANY